MPAALVKSAIAFSVTVAVLGAAWANLERPDTLIERSVAGAIEGLEKARPVASVPTFDPAHVHLSRLPASPAAANWTVGARMSLAGNGGGVATYEVTDVRPLSTSVSFDGGAPETGLTLVTATSVGMLPTHSIRFIVDTNGAAALMRPPMKPHAL